MHSGYKYCRHRSNYDGKYQCAKVMKIASLAVNTSPWLFYILM